MFHVEQFKPPIFTDFRPYPPKFDTIRHDPSHVSPCVVFTRFTNTIPVFKNIKPQNYYTKSLKILNTPMFSHTKHKFINTKHDLVYKY